MDPQAMLATRSTPPSVIFNAQKLMRPAPIQNVIPRGIQESPNTSLDSSSPQSADEYIPKFFPGAAQVLLHGRTALDEFNDDRFTLQRKSNLYYPLANRSEWEFACWLLNSSLSMGEIDDFLNLDTSRNRHLSFRTAKELKARMDLLPPVARWQSKQIVMDPRYPTTKDVYLYYRDAIEVLQDILKSPLIQDHLSFTPFQLYESASKLNRIYESWLSSDHAWTLQSALPAGRTLLGTILSSDKTNISIMTGNRSAHPLLISLANIDSDVVSKASLNLLQLLALLPIPVFRHPSQEIRGVLDNRLYHRCLDIVLRPLKIAAAIGCLLADPVGQVRRCHTLGAAWIVDTPEASLISCVGGAGKTSPFTTAMFKDYGDPFRHPTRTGDLTLTTIANLATKADPTDIERYWPLAQKSRTNGVVRPCWRDWPLSDPSKFLLPEILHHWHKFFFDHDLKWCIRALGADEIDFRFSLVQKRQGFRSFSEGVSRLKQVTGRDQREIQRYIVTVIAGATTPKFLTAIRSLCDFRYAGQAPCFNDASAARLQLALDEFHQVKDEVMRLKVRTNAKGEPIENWEIPKLEFLQNVFPSIKLSGPVIQWDANKTERAHITTVKLPARSGNGRQYEMQICRELDLQTRMRQFDLMTSMKDADVDFRVNGDSHEGGEVETAAKGAVNEVVQGAGKVPPQSNIKIISSTSKLRQNILPVSVKMWGATRSDKNLFVAAQVACKDPNANQPLRSFLGNRGQTAFHLIRDPDLKTLAVDQAQTQFNLPDFSGALLDYLHRAKSHPRVFTIAGRRTPVAEDPPFLPFKVKVWSRVRIQGRQYHNLHLPNNTRTIFASPPDHEWNYGRFDCVVININDSQVWPRSSLEGHCVVMVKMIFAPAYGRTEPHLPGTDQFLAYCERFDVVNQHAPPPEYSSLPCYQAWKPNYPDYNSGCYVLKRASRNGGSAFGDIIPVSQFRAQVDVAPRLRGAANSRLSSSNVMMYANDYLLNKFWEKELWYALEKAGS